MKFFITLITSLTFFSSCSILNEKADNLSLSGRKWKLTAINQKPVNLDGDKAFIEFDEKDQKIKGKAACNSFSGDFEKTGAGNQIEIQELVSTKMYCEGLMDQENQIITNLQQVKRYEIKTGMLYLYDSGELLLTFKK